MRITIYKPVQGESDVLIQPAIRRRLPPVLLKRVAKEDLAKQVADIADKVVMPPT